MAEERKDPDLNLLPGRQTIRRCVYLKRGHSMYLDVTFFALYRERAGCNRLQFELPEGGTVADLTAVIRRKFPRLAPPEVKIVVAVNTEYADPEFVLHEGDDVCLIPPVSGG